MSRPALVIANPAAAGGEGRRRWNNRIAERMQRRLGSLELAWTEAAGDAERLAREAADSRPLVVAFGGDGTASEVARGLAAAADSGEAEFGILPCGTGNDFAAAAGIPRALPEAVDFLASAGARPTDLGLLQLDDDAPGHFLNSCSLGLAAAVVERTATGPRRSGKATYALAAAREIATHASRIVWLSLDGEPERPRAVLDLSVLNGRRFGGGIPLAPTADPGDGRLDAVLIGPLRLSAIPDAVCRLLRGDHFSRRELSHAPVRRLRARWEDGPAVLEVDGEVRRATASLSISVAPGAVRLRRP